MRSRLAGSQGGFVLAIIVVFIVVLSLTAYLVARLTRTDLQVVRNIENEKAAFYVAEAGTTEALIRLRRLPTTHLVTVDGLTFSPDVVPIADPGWNARITFTPALPVLAGTTFTTPTIQPASPRRLPYSDVVGGTEPPLHLAWVSDGSGGIRKVGGRNVLRITSTGRSGNARRTVVIHAVQAAAAECTLGGVCTLSTSCESVSLSGNADVELCGGMAINSPCADEALRTGNNTSLDAPGGIDVVGGYNGAGSISPSPNTGAAAFSDPLADLPELAATSCDFNTNAYQGPGVYCRGLRIGGNDNVTFATGDYVIAGGALDISGNSSVIRGTGVTFHIARHPTSGQWGSVDFGPGAVDPLLAAPTSGTYAGVLIFQHRANPNELRIRGTFNQGLDGVIYAPSAHVSFQNQTNPGKDLSIGLVVGSVSFVGDNALGCPTIAFPPGGGNRPNGFLEIAWNDWAS